jgi:UDP-N-acetylglucosamine 2-epimerase
MKVVSIVGARPQFVKAGPLSRLIRRGHQEVLVHTGQHYDYGLSDVFFDELGIPTPDYNLGVGSGSHGAQTGAMLASIESVLQQEQPDVVVVYGDTNSTLAGALAAVKLLIPLAHVEAGLRSFNRAMPEEINRIVADHVANLLFAPSQVAADQLRQEGVERGVHVVGDIMIDALHLYRERADARPNPLERLGIRPRCYYLATLHRAENTDRPANLAGILEALARLDAPVILPLHPRTAQRIEDSGLQPSAHIRVVEPQGYLDMLRLQESAACILTDSGGVQKEAYYLRVPCVTLRNETEWVETVQTGWNVLAGADPERIVSAVANRPGTDLPHPDLYGDGRAAERIVGLLSTI